MPHRHILLAEDDPQCARLTMVVLEKIHPGIRIAHVSDGVRALEYLESRGEYAGRTPQPPTVVLLDLKMPRLDGFGVLERMRSNPEHRLHRVVVLSSSAYECDVQRAYELGASGYVVKNIDFNLFRSSLQAIWDFWGVVNLPPSAPAKG
ncbi:MAG: response regulator [Chthoniobacteraceae bacterium]